jgi:GT2 family glycosyltransferase
LPSPGEVDSIDGIVIVLSPWAVRELRFDESLGSLHGYDFDICMQARAAGKKVVTADFRAIHHHSLKLVSDPEGWIQTHTLGWWKNGRTTYACAGTAQDPSEMT